MPELLADVQRCLLDAQTEVQDVSGWNAPISSYQPNPPSLQRLNTNPMTGLPTIPTTNFMRQDVKVISERTAAKFWGKAWLELEKQDRIYLSQDLQNECFTIHYRSGKEKPGVLILELKTPCGRRRHCAMTQHSLDGIPPGHVVAPEWVMEDLFLEATPGDGDLRRLLHRLEEQQGRLCARIGDMKPPEQKAIAKAEVQCTLEPVSVSPQKFSVPEGKTVAVLPGKSLFADHLHVQYQTEQGWALRKDFEICDPLPWPPESAEKKVASGVVQLAMEVAQLARAVLAEKCWCGPDSKLAECMTTIVNLLHPGTNDLYDVVVAREVCDHTVWRQNFPQLLSDYGCFNGSRSVRLRSVTLEPCQYIKMQPHSTDFYKLLGDTDVKSVLNKCFRQTCSALTEDTTVLLDIQGTRCPVYITQLRPNGAVRLVEEDLDLVMKPEVDFDPPPDLLDKEAVRAWQDKLMEVEKAKRELETAMETNNKEELNAAIQRCANAKVPTERATRHLARIADREARFEKLRLELQEKAGADDGSSGEVKLAMQLPDSSTLKPQFPKGATCVALHALAMNSSWARQACCFAGVELFLQGRPGLARPVAMAELVDDLRGCRIIVKSTPADDDLDDDIKPVPPPAPALERSSSAWHRIQDNTEQQFRIELALQDREVQRWIDSGTSQEEAIEKVKRGELLPEPEPQLRFESWMTEEESPSTPLGRTRSNEEQLIEQVMDMIATQDRCFAQELLEMHGWNAARTIDAFFTQLSA